VKLWLSSNLELGLRKKVGMRSSMAIEVLDRSCGLINSWAASSLGGCSAERLSVGV
jgi:hypothetical protein